MKKNQDLNLEIKRFEKLRIEKNQPSKETRAQSSSDEDFNEIPPIDIEEIEDLKTRFSHDYD